MKFFDPVTASDPSTVSVVEGGLDPQFFEGKLWVVNDMRKVRSYDVSPDGTLAEAASIDPQLSCRKTISTHRYRDGAAFVGVGRATLTSETPGGMCDGGWYAREATEVRRYTFTSGGTPQLSTLVDVGAGYSHAAWLTGRVLLVGDPNATLLGWSDEATTVVGSIRLAHRPCYWRRAVWPPIEPNPAIHYVPGPELALVKLCPVSDPETVQLLGVGADQLLDHGVFDLGIKAHDEVRSVQWANDRLLFVTLDEVVSVDVTNPDAPVIVSRVSAD